MSAPGLNLDRYLELDLALVYIPPNSKAPNGNGWQQHPVTTPDEAARVWQHGGNVGVVHQHSGTLALDVDDYEGAKRALERVGINLGDLLSAPGPKIKSPRGLKPLYRLPGGVTLKRVALAWPTAETCHLPKAQQKLETIFELRAGATQDVLPGSVHPDGTAYEWVDEPRERDDIPLIPGGLLTLAQNWQELKPFMLVAAPGYVPPQPKPRELGGTQGDGVIRTFNEHHSLTDILAEHGYKPKGDRWLSPHSASGIPGVVLLKGDDGLERVYCHHAADPLNTGHAEDAFGVFAVLHHDGDAKAAVKAAAAALGLSNTSKKEANSIEYKEPTWGPRQALPPLHPAAPSLPSELLAAALRPWLDDAAERLCTRRELLAAPALIGLASLFGRKLAVRPKARDTSWLEPLNLYGAAVALPSSLKTPAQTEALSHLQAIAHDALREFEAGAAAREAALELARLELAALKAPRGREAALPNADSLAAALARVSDLERENRPRRYIVGDITTEKLAELSAHNPDGLLCHRDELAGLLRSFEKSGRETDRSFYLEAWSGLNPYSVDRVGRGSFTVPALCLSLFGTTQPGPFSRYVAEALGGGEGADGFLSRLNLLVWIDDQPEFVNVERDRDHDAYNRARRVYRKAAAFNPAEYPGVELETALPSLGFSPDAQELFTGWRVTLMRRLRSPELAGAEAFSSHLGKYPGFVARLACLFHLTEHLDGGNGGGPISLTNAALALQWAAFLEAHARRVYAAELGAERRAMRTLAKAVETGRVADGESVRNVYRRGLEGLSTKSDVRAAVEQLARHGWVRLQTSTPGKQGGRPTELVRVHPELR